jgi:branched-chain amino acid transport system ATP-binding protein
VAERIRGWWWPLAHPVGWLRDVAGDGPAFALFVLFGLNAVDELDRTAFGILLPEIRDEFGLGLQGVLTLIGVVTLGALVLQVPIGSLADRHSRVVIAVVGAAMWGFFSLLTGVASGIVMLAIVRSGTGIGRATVDPTHNSLIADWYAPANRPRVYSVHRAANAVGAFVGPLTAGLIAYWFSWRVPFVVFAIPTFVFVVLGLRLREPIRGAQERRAMGADEDVINTEEVAPSFAEGWRMVWKIETLRRIWYSLPFLAASIIGFVSLAALMYEQEFNLDERARGFVAASVEPFQLVGLIIGARIGTRLVAKDPSLIMGFLARVAWLVSGCLIIFAVSPNIGVAIVANAVITGSLSILLPGIFASLSLAIPPRARSIGFSVAALWIIPGLVVLPIVGAIGDRYSIRWGMIVMVPIFLVGGLVIASAKKSVNADITHVWTAAAALSEALYVRRQGRS